MTINRGVGAVDHDVDGRRQVWRECEVHLLCIVGGNMRISIIHALVIAFDNHRRAESRV